MDIVRLQICWHCEGRWLFHRPKVHGMEAAAADAMMGEITYLRPLLRDGAPLPPAEFEHFMRMLEQYFNSKLWSF